MLINEIELISSNAFTFKSISAKYIAKYQQKLSRPDVYTTSVIGNFSTFKVVRMNEDSENEIAFLLLERNQVAAVFSFYLLDNYMQSEMSIVSNEYAGKNIAPLFYKWLLVKNITKSIMSGNTQTPGGKSIWKRLCKLPDITVFVWNKRTDSASAIELEDFLDGSIDLYDEDSADEEDAINDEIKQLHWNYNMDTPDNVNKKVEELEDQLSKVRQQKRDIRDLLVLVAHKKVK